MTDWIVALGRFNNTIIFAICERQIVDILDPAVGVLAFMTSPLLGRILLTKSRSTAAINIAALHVLSSVNQGLDELTQPMGYTRLQRHLMIGEAIAANLKNATIKSTYEGVNLGHHRLLCSSMIAENHSPQDSVFASIDRIYNLFCGAIITGNISLVQSMAASVDVNALNVFFGRPLGLAAVWGHLDIVRYLLDHGADPHIIAERWERWDNDILTINNGVYEHEYRCPGGSALSAAALGGNKEIVSLLLEPEFRLSPSSSEYHRAILCAVRIGRTDIVDMFLEVQGISIYDLKHFKDLMLWEAVCHNRESMVQLLVDNSADINRDGPLIREHGCALHLAAQNGYDNLIRLLLDQGADISYVSSYKSLTPMGFAARGGHLEAVQVLVEYGEKLEHALVPAASTGQSHMVKWLVEKGVDLNYCHYDENIGIQALVQAIMVKNLGIISILAAAGVPLNNDDSDLSRDPVWVAKSLSSPWVFEFLLSIGAQDREYSEDQLIDKREERMYELGRYGLLDVNQETWMWQGKY
ncbi:F-box domain and ankyrin repeat protein [Trichophyton verrucosum HKI 0517]|uniref:F-box domain and ankyrin repeat protein n=1 Tax=Trichophyton verrucosum (strain HKI 0517) TaxID=663202 RepID=D4D8N5_TRIVH|nr:F-box domain and ankyrin repeat protein [Trichophyton verrucosum HKI 0517]EFE41790.1 F-box domain and ankyrin repeat protein [Trichophyton verrucosum HKI 0517]